MSLRSVVSALGVLAIAGSVMLGCGEAEPQSKAQFVVKANEICVSLVTLQRRALDEIGDSYTGSADDLKDAIEALRDVIATRLERIKDLGQPSEPPHAYTVTLRKFVNRLEKAPSADPQTGVINAGPIQQILASAQPTLIREAKAYGMDDCQHLDAKPLPLLEQPLNGSTLAH